MNPFHSFARKPTSLTVLGLALVTGCAVGPDYQRPALPGQTAHVTVGADQPPTVASTATDPATPWWRSAGDPVLTELVERALANNRDLRGALARIDESRALRRETRSAFLPSGSVSAGYRRQLDSTVFFNGVSREARDQDIFDLGLDASWELDLFGRVRRSLEAGDALARAADADLAQLRLLIANDIARAYIEYQTALGLIDLRERQVEAVKNTLEILTQQIDEGNLGREQGAPVESELATLQGALRDLRLIQRYARNRLGVLVGEGVTPELPARATLMLPAPAIERDPVRLLERRPDVQAAERRLAASTAAIGIARADYFPTLKLVGRVGADATKLDDITAADANFFSFGPRLSWDLLSLHRVHARAKGAEARSQQALATWEQTVLLSLEEIDNALARRNEAIGRRQEWQHAATTAQEALRIAEARHGEGVLDPKERLATESAALNARTELVRADAELAIATLYLQRSMAIN